MSLASKYRPKKFEDVIGQKSVIQILSKQVNTNTFGNCYLISGPSGCGKTTLARIMASEINNGQGEPFEIDAASNNGVENIRQIVESSQERALDCNYKIYIIDECHSLTNQAWQAFLKTIEEPPKYTIFMFCTTDPQKVPDTISNRCQTYKLNRLSDSEIISRLKYISQTEGISADENSLNYIARLSNGSMRQAISYLDKCKDYSEVITEKSVIETLGNCSYDLFFDLINSKIDGKRDNIIKIIEGVYLSGDDLKLFIDNFINFSFDILKYIIFKDLSLTQIPISYKSQIDYTTNIEDNERFFKQFLNKLIEIKLAIKEDSNYKSTIEIMLVV